MASIHLTQRGYHYDNIHVQNLLPSSSQSPSTSYDADDTFGEPEILTRIGDEYQVELPQLHGELNSSPQQNVLLGSPIKLAWIRSDRKSLDESEYVTSLGECSCSVSRLVPGVCDEQWSEAEKDSFLLGLYIFAKNFVEVRKFVGTKEIGSLLSYYYGKFCSSPQHRRWSNNRRVKHKKGTFGRGMFSGLRLQELLSRLLPRVFKSFENEKISMREFVFSLKAMVGTDILVEGCGIGREHQDLTVMSLGPSKSNLVTKACSSLSTAEISELLSRKNRLSKARSCDLFWEAVWPLLQANGWHSEQPTSSSPNLVFLMPGINKFSRRRLVRGDHYFDSISGVLSRVALEPCLLELKHEECEQMDEDKHENDTISPMEFTVVDTCLSNGKVFELRSLPSEASSDASDSGGSPRAKRARVCSQVSLDRSELLIDLNLPRVPPDCEDGSVSAESSQEQDVPSNKPDGEGVQELECNSNGTRYSKRLRPPTTRLLECFARGYLTVNRRQKRKEATPSQDNA